MTVDLQLNLFGAFSAKNRYGQEIAFRDDKVRALLAYLVVERDRPHRRAALAEMFWGGAPEPRARQSLRMALTRLRQSMNESSAAAQFLLVTRQNVQVRTDADLHEIDTVAFDQLAAQYAHYQAGDLCENPFVRDWMEKAVAYYRGSFLAGLTLADSPQFDDWLLMMQGRYEQQTLFFLETLSEDALANGRIEAAGRFARRQLEMIPWLESAHRQMMRIYAQRGQGQLVEHQYQSCVHILNTELGTQPEPETKQLLEQIKSGQYQTRQVRTESHPGIIVEVPNNLPRQHTPFFGREAERGKLIRTLLDEHYSLITIAGPGGVGKTRLSMDMARHFLHQPAFEDGVWFIPLDGLRGDSENLYESIATTMAAILDLELARTIDPHQQLFDHLACKKMLLILDNFEQLIGEADGTGDGVDFVLDLLQRTSQIKMVVSSRRPLDIQLEAVITLNGLPVPQNADERAYTYSSIQLFAERAQRANQRFALTTETLPEVVKICQMMAGMPLGLELVAVRLREMNLPQVTQALHSNLDLLKTRMRDLPERHRSLRAVFDWSWSLLADDEKRVVAELSVFRGSFSLDAVQVITGAEPDLVYALISHSLVRIDDGRYSLHELLRQFAAEKLEDIEQVNANHSEYYLRFVQDRADSLIRKNLAEITKEIQPEWENIQQAWHFATETQNITLLNRTISGLGYYLRNSGMLWMGRKLFEAAIARLEEIDKTITSREYQQTLSKLKLELAQSLFWSAQYDICISNAQQVLEFGETWGDLTLVVSAKLEIGRAYWRLGDYELAGTLLEQALAAEPDEPWLTVRILNSLGNTYNARGNLNRATGCYQHALHLQKENDIWSNRVQVLNNLATIYALQGHFGQATSLLYEVLDASKQFNQQYYQVTIYHNLGLAHCETGQYMQSAENFEQALKLSHQLQNRQIETDIWLGLAQLYRRLGQFERSEVHIDKAITLCDQFGEKKSKSEARMHQALIHYTREQYETALQNSSQSVQLNTELGPTEIDADLMLTHGCCHLALGQLEEARVAFQKVLVLEQKLGNPIKKAEALTGLAQVDLEFGDRPPVRQYLEEVWACYLARESFMGTILPYHLYLRLFHIFKALEDPRAAKILREAQDLIRAQAMLIPDLEMRKTFLDQPICSQLLDL